MASKKAQSKFAEDLEVCENTSKIKKAAPMYAFKPKKLQIPMPTRAQSSTQKIISSFCNRHLKSLFFMHLSATVKQAESKNTPQDTHTFCVSKEKLKKTNAV